MNKLNKIIGNKRGISVVMYCFLCFIEIDGSDVFIHIFSTVSIILFLQLLQEINVKF